jgi:hypothetical protein
MPSIATDRLTGISASRAIKAPCVAVATTAITMSGEQTVNGVACVTGDRVLRAVSGAQVDNGIWVVDTGQWSRAVDFDGSRDITKGTLILTAPGTSQALIYQVKTSGTITPGVTAIEIAEFSGDAVSLRSDLASAASASVGAGMIGYGAGVPYGSGVGLMIRAQEMSLWEHLTSAQIADAQAGTLAVDCSAAIQYAITEAESDNQYSGRTLRLPAGRYRANAESLLSKQFIRITGEGAYQSVIVPTGAGVNGLSVAAINYLRPFFADFSIRGASNTGRAIDLDDILLEVYLGELRNMILESGGIALAARRFFSMVVSNIAGVSVNDHTFRVSCGPGTSWISCYAIECGAGKAGYRLLGIINMLGCNGLNSGDWWGIFGQDTAASDGYQADFSVAGNDFPDINLIGCNLEEYASKSTNGGGLLIHNTYRHFNMIGGKFDRNNLSTGYKAIVHARKGSNSPEQPIRLAPGSVFPGAGTPSLAALYTDSGARFWDENSTFTGASITTWRDAGAALNYPLLTDGATGDLYGDNAHSFSALYPRRLSVRMMRYAVLDHTTTGANQTVNVTGYTKVKLSPGSSSSFDKFSLTETAGGGDDYGRNGDLIIEAGTANATLNHNIAGAGGMRMKGGANVTMALGEIRRFVRSDNYTSGVAGWVEV